MLIPFQDKVPNKKVIFSDEEDGNIDKNNSTYQDIVNNKPKNGKNILFDDEESDSEVTFEIKKQFEGKKGQKVSYMKCHRIVCQLIFIHNI